MKGKIKHILRNLFEDFEDFYFYFVSRTNYSPDGKINPFFLFMEFCFKIMKSIIVVLTEGLILTKSHPLIRPFMKSCLKILEITVFPERIIR